MSVMSTSSPCQTGCGWGDLHGLGENRPRIQIVHSWMSCGSRCLFRSRLHGLKSSSQVILHEWSADNLGEMLVGRLGLPSPPGQDGSWDLLGHLCPSWLDPGISWGIFARAGDLLGCFASHLRVIGPNLARHRAGVRFEQILNPAELKMPFGDVFVHSSFA